MKIVLLTRRNVGMIALNYLVAKRYFVEVISDDEDVLWLAERLKCDTVTMETMGGYDMILSVHWNKIIPSKYLNKVAVNIHPCLKEGYKGKNPVERYIAAGRETASITSHHMTDKVDEGEEIATVSFWTGKISNYAEFYNIAFKEYYHLLDKTFKIIGK